MRFFSKCSTLFSLIAYKLGKGGHYRSKNIYNFNCPEKKIVIIVPSYNNEKWCKKNLDSIRQQNYDNFKVIYINDNSIDKTGKLVESYIKAYKLEEKFTVINNKKRRGALENQYNAIHACSNDDIIVLVDGDDQLSHSDVLKIINSQYQNKDIWVTYGQLRVIPSGKIWECTRFSQNIIKKNEFRKTPFFVSHLRTFYAGLFKLIKKEDLFYQGNFFSMTGDRAVMAPLIEMTGGKFAYIPDILYFYNTANQISDYNVDSELQCKLNDIIMNMPPYKPVSWEDILDA